MRLIAILAAALATSATNAQHVEAVTSPTLNVPHTASAGEVIWSIRAASKSTLRETTYILDERAYGGGFFSTKGTADMPAGSRLVGVQTQRGLKACEENAHDALIDSVRACFTDEDNDGAFDHYSYKENAALGGLKAPARYHKLERSEDVEHGSFQVQVSYLGVNAGGLSLSYREFTNGLARPAFTENLSIPLGPQYPQSVRFKGVEMKVIGVDGLGLRYVIVSAPSTLPSKSTE